jgi:AraC-like DNA-binding protein
MRRDFSHFPSVLVRARALTGFADLVAAHGGDAAALMAGVGLPLAVLDAPEDAVPLARAMVLLEDAAETLGMPDFGLQLAQKQDINVLGAVALFARHAATLGDALAALAQNLPYHSPGLRMTIDDDPARHGHARLRLAFDPGVELPQRQALELSFGVTSHFLRITSNDSGAGWILSLRHAALPGTVYRRYFSGTVLCGQSADALSFPSRLLDVALAPDSVALQAAAQRYVNSLVRRYPQDITRQVEALVDRQLAGGGGNLVQIARTLGLHERTLQRRLKEQGVYFEDIVDRLRRKRAEEFLACQAISLAQVAALLGYSEQSSFIRVCKRWFGSTPQAYRRQLQPLVSRGTGG